MSVPTPAELAATPLHAVVRDHPETLVVCRRFGVDLPRRGGEPLGSALDGDVAPLLDAVAAAIGWREGA